jgi:hypothetical protein
MGNGEKDKLRTLLNYWIEHNKEHGQEFRDWVTKAREFGEAGVSDDVLLAAQEMDKATEILSRALRRLEGKEG